MYPDLVLPQSADDVGHLLFGRSLRLRVARAIYDAGDQTFFAAVIADDLHVPASNVTQELDRFDALGMIERVPAVRGDRAKRFRKAASPLWRVVAEAVTVIDEGFDDQVRSLARDAAERDS